MNARTPRVLILGVGAIGGFYGALLHRAGAEVSVICRSDYDVVARDGLRVDSPLGDLSFRPAAVYRGPEQCPTAPERLPDMLLVTLKIVDGIDRAALMRPLVGPATSIVLIENGVDIEADIAAAFPHNPLVSALAHVAITRVGPGHVRHQAYGQLVLGDYPSGVGAAARQLSALLKAGGVEAPLSDDVVLERWHKAVWNAAFNPVSVLAGGADTRTLLGTPDGEALIRALMEEVCSVAEGAGHRPQRQRIDPLLQQTRAMPPYRTSMAQDFLSGRPMEVEAIAGNIVRVARRLGVSAPRLETLYTLLRWLQASRAQTT